MSRLVSLSSTTRMQAGLFMLVSQSMIRLWCEAGPAIPPLSGQEFPDLCQQLARTIRLCDIGVAAGGTRFGLIAAQRVRSHDDDRNGFEIWVGLDAPRRLVAVEQWQLNVHENEIGALRLGRGDSRFAVAGFAHGVAGATEEIAQNLAVVLLILDDENSLAHGRPAWCSTRNGTVNEKVEPAPRLDSTHSLPPCISMIRFAIDKPSPVPPLALVCVLSACWNSSKIFAWSASAMPGPVSRTEMV